VAPEVVEKLRDLSDQLKNPGIVPYWNVEISEGRPILTRRTHVRGEPVDTKVFEKEESARKLAEEVVAVLREHELATTEVFFLVMWDWSRWQLALDWPRLSEVKNRAPGVFEKLKYLRDLLPDPGIVRCWRAEVTGSSPVLRQKPLVDGEPIGPSYFRENEKEAQALAERIVRVLHENDLPTTDLLQAWEWFEWEEGGGRIWLDDVKTRAPEAAEKLGRIKNRLPEATFVRCWDVEITGGRPVLRPKSHTRGEPIAPQIFGDNEAGVRRFADEVLGLLQKHDLAAIDLPALWNWLGWDRVHHLFLTPRDPGDLHVGGPILYRFSIIDTILDRRPENRENYKRHFLGQGLNRQFTVGDPGWLWPFEEEQTFKRRVREKFEEELARYLDALRGDLAEIEAERVNLKRERKHFVWFAQYNARRWGPEEIRRDHRRRHPQEEAEAGSDSTILDAVKDVADLTGVPKRHPRRGPRPRSS
jgi:hypothetical protein